MKAFDRESWLEAGLLVLAAGILAGVGLLVYGKTMGTVNHTHKRRQAAPAPGSVSQKRHENIGSNAAR